MTTRLKVISSPSGEPKIGVILTVSDEVAKRMLRTGKVEVWTEPPAAAGTTTSGELSEAGQALQQRALDEEQARTAGVDPGTPVDPPAPSTETTDGSASAGDVDPLADPAKPAGPMDVNTATETSGGTAAPKPAAPRAPKA